MLDPTKLDDILVSLDTWGVVAGKKTIGLGPVSCAVFRLLLRNAGKAVSREQLSHCFAGRILNAYNVRNHIAALRLKLGPSIGKRIRTIPGVGWRAPGGYMYKSPARSHNDNAIAF